MQLGFTACALPPGTAALLRCCYNVHVLINLSAYMYLQAATISYIVRCILVVELVGQQYNGQHSTIFVVLMAESCAVLLLSICSTLCGNLKLLSIL